MDALNVVRKPVEEHLIVRIEELVEKTFDRSAGIDDLVASHAAARIEHDPKAHGDALCAEMRDVDRPIVLVDREVGLSQSCHKVAGPIRDRRCDVDQLDATEEAEALLPRQPAVWHQQRGYARYGEDHAATNEDESYVTVDPKVRWLRRSDRRCEAKALPRRSRVPGVLSTRIVAGLRLATPPADGSCHLMHVVTHRGVHAICRNWTAATSRILHGHGFCRVTRRVLSRRRYRIQTIWSST